MITLEMKERKKERKTDRHPRQMKKWKWVASCTCILACTVNILQLQVNAPKVENPHHKYMFCWIDKKNTFTQLFVMSYNLDSRLSVRTQEPPHVVNYTCKTTIIDRARKRSIDGINQ